MCVTRRLISLFAAVLLLLQCGSLLLAPVTARGSPPEATRWQTLSGDAPLVVARGGFSGMFPYGSSAAYQFPYGVSLPDTVLWCDVQLTKDSVGICSSDILLDNGTNIQQAFPRKDKQYVLNGVPTPGSFSIDFYSKELSTVVLIQGIYSRTEKFDYNYGIQTVEDVANFKPAGLWLNIQYDAFYSQHNLSMRSYVISLSRRVDINYLSSPEVGFLRSIASRFNPKVTKLVFQFLHPDDVEPSTIQTYSSLLKNLTFIKTFASGIIIPKDYVWPVDSQSYLLPHTSIVLDAHKAGLEVFASGFYNDVPLSYNYSSDPITEYLHFINNGDFSVDGVLSDFPITPSEAIACFSHLGRNASNQVDALVITKNGASGDYPGCTDLAYQKAILDGADVIDCPIQVSSDGIPFCLGSINLFDNTDAALSPFAKLSQTIPELNSGIGLFSFSLKWSEIQQLKPVISNPFSKFYLYRNPNFRNAGSFLKLSDFLALAMNSSSLSGVLINIENAPYLIEKQGIPVIDTVLTALSNAGYGNKTAKRVMIQSSNNSVLMKFKGKQEYELVYKIDENIGDALPDTVADIKSFASAVVLNKESIFPVSGQFTTTVSKVVSTLNSSGIPIYAETFSNEFVSQAWDFFSDATVELNSFVFNGNVAGMITGFPLTAARYKKNRCLGSEIPPYMAPALPGALLSAIAPNAKPPTEAPDPVLTVSDVAEPPLFNKKAPVPSPDGGNTPAGGSAPGNGQHKIAACFTKMSSPVVKTLPHFFSEV